ncbi:MAG TPA: hypothetical protein VLR69_02835 [Thermoanaerobaculia bacterium]|nr:hypothetical protein [Thermoanaerobaculia bacterium]
MRDVTKSMLSLSWALSLFGLKQMASLLNPQGNPQGNAAASFEAVTRSAEDQLGPAARSAFRSGDNLQRGLVDLMFSLFTFGLWPGGSRGGAAGRSGWGASGWGPCGDTSSSGWGQGDAGQQTGWTPGDTGQQGGWTVGGVGQPAGWSPESGGGGWQVGGGAGVAAAGAEAFQSGGDLAAQTMGWGIDMMQQGADAVSQTLEGAAAPQPAAPGGDGWTTGGGSDPR